MSDLSVFFTPEVLSTTLRMLVPVLLVSLGGALTNKAGIENIGLEGLMLFGCFGAFAADYYTGSWIWGIVGGMALTLAVSMIFGLFVITLKANEIVAGVAINLLGAGLTTYLLRSIFGVSGSFSDERVQAIPSLHLPFLDGVPILDKVLNNKCILIWVALLLVAAVHIMVYHTKFGYYMRAAGANEEALKTAGVNVVSIRYKTVFVHGLLCGLGGAYLSIGYLVRFAENMSSGRGFLAMAAIAFGSADPLRVFGASVLFAFVESISNRMQLIKIPSYFTDMIPYIITIIALSIMSYRAMHRRKGRLKI